MKPAASNPKRDRHDAGAAGAAAAATGSSSDDKSSSSSLAVARDISTKASTAGGMIESLPSSRGAMTTGKFLSALYLAGSFAEGAPPASAEPMKPLGSAEEASGLPSCGSAMSESPDCGRSVGSRV
jgi:hypothetical protein